MWYAGGWGGGGGVMIDAVTGLKNSWETLLPVNFFKSQYAPE